MSAHIQSRVLRSRAALFSCMQQAQACIIPRKRRTKNAAHKDTGELSLCHFVAMTG
jgi:hypothetical protein